MEQQGTIPMSNHDIIELTVKSKNRTNYGQNTTYTYIVDGLRGICCYLAIATLAEGLMHLPGVATIASRHGDSTRVHRLLHLGIIAISIPVLASAPE